MHRHSRYTVQKSIFKNLSYGLARQGASQDSGMPRPRLRKPFEQGCTVPQARRLARTSTNKASVFDDKGRPLQPFFFHPTQQLENECPDNELFWTDKAVWSTHLKKRHPANLNEIQQILGLTNFFRKYIRGYTSLTVSLKKNTPLDWTTACQNSLARLKTALTSSSKFGSARHNRRQPQLLTWIVMFLGLVLALCSPNKVGLLLSDLGKWCLLSKNIKLLSKSCLLSLKH